jgi:hypothetical protein
MAEVTTGTQRAPALPRAIGITHTRPDGDVATNRKVDPSKINTLQAKKGNMG